MSAHIEESFAFTIVGDGVATSITIELKGFIKLKGVFPLTPSTIISLSSSVTPAITSSSLSGSKITVNYAGIIDSGSLTVNLGF